MTRIPPITHEEKEHSAGTKSSTTCGQHTRPGDRESNISYHCPAGPLILSLSFGVKVIFHTL